MVDELTKDTFPKVTKAPGVAVVDFWAPWCGPCIRMEPAFQAAAKEVPQARFGKVNVDEQPDIGTQFGVMAIPTTVFFKDGRIVDQHVGEIRQSDLVKKVKALLT